jgi:hypothetical protein
VVDYFDPYNPEHLKEYQKFPLDRFPIGLAYPREWEKQIERKIITAWLNEFQSNKE